MPRRIKTETDPDTGIILRETYFENRLRHRDPADGPADIWRDAAAGVAYHEYYMWRGRPHNSGGPAEIHRNPDHGKVTVEICWRHGQRHREPTEGPAEIRRDWDTGTKLRHESYYMYDVLYRDPADGASFTTWDSAGEIESRISSNPAATRPTPPMQRRSTRQNRQPGR